MKQYVVIGGSSGIGWALTQSLAEKGAGVFASYNKHERSSSGAVQFFHYDVLHPEASFSFLPDVIDGLAFCPGSIVLKPFARISSQEFVLDYQLQVGGAIQVLQQLLPRLKKSSAASVVLFSTIAVQTGFPFHTLVSSSKGAIEGLTRALAAELAPVVRVNCIAPSVTDTPLAATLLNSEEKRTANALRHPLKKIGTPADVAAAACYLLSDESAWMTGQILHLDGGLSSIKTTG